MDSQPTVDFEKTGPKKSIRKLMYYFLEVPKMKNVKLLTNAIVLALTLAAVSVQANDLVEVETININELAVNVNTELAQSLKAMSTLTLDVEKSAENILLTQNKKQVNDLDFEPTQVSIAD